MEAITLSRPYAKAVFVLAQEQNSLNHWQSVLEALVQIIKLKKIQAYLGQPLLTTDQKSKCVIAAGGKLLDKLAQNFTVILANNNRLDLLPAIQQHFIIYKNQAQNSLDIDITTAYELDAAQHGKLENELKAAFAKDRIYLDCQTDQGLLGGIIIKIKDLVIDHSISGRIKKLRGCMGIIRAY